ncbi:signal recognition particle subunit SRP54 [Candidatus Kinetoplastibacterium oncopeltii TCC290E]|uniref:Signal recognition particle protein n=1 Tax=Candidatus Kinetoplastidibacterium stringomonadis TCC290E TaxID=1208920 RepID=M1L670_9PROT|nr:signal recognition particle protein [Candidatus Kinetoplastibacterium oncopeltii]AGF48108.1 signal recognition particle subunit SRP54 [Candidatus Kinetoplastibacterium oncopeltii TCC290E]
MLDSLTSKMSRVLKKIRGEARLTESNTKEMFREIRIALLEADVSFQLVKNFIDALKNKSLGSDVLDSLNPGQALVGIVHKELTALMGGDLGEYSNEISLSVSPPATIMFVGLQGVGKTTTVGKIAYWLSNDNHTKYGKKTGKKKILITSVDTYRPSAIDQLRIISQQIGIDFFNNNSDDPMIIASDALSYAKKHYYNILLIDTAGRLGIDESMMDEVKSLSKITKPVETLLVVDAMQGQDSINTAKSFSEILPLTGIILTKLDGDVRGGAALSARQITGVPLKFIGTSEKIDGLEIFSPDRMARRILGMGDILSLVEKAQNNVNLADVGSIVSKIRSSDKFDLNDFRLQLTQMKKLGGIEGIIDSIPSHFRSSKMFNLGQSENFIKKAEAIINSMTKEERAKSDIIKSSRKKRIATGSGVSIQDINQLLSQFDKAKLMMKKIQKGGISKMLRSIKSIGNLF